jgi:hypothetical protein
MLSYVVLSLLSGAAWAGETPLSAAEISKYGIGVDRDANGFSLKAENKIKKTCFENLSVSYGSVSGDTLKLNVVYTGSVKGIDACQAALKKQKNEIQPVRSISISSADLEKPKSDILKVQLNDAAAKEMTAAIKKPEVKKSSVAKDKIKLTVDGTKLFAEVETTKDCEDQLISSLETKEGEKEYSKDEGLKALADVITVTVDAPEECTGEEVTKKIQVGTIDKDSIALVTYAEDDAEIESPAYSKALALEKKVNCDECSIKDDKSEEFVKLLEKAGKEAPDLLDVFEKRQKEATADAIDKLAERYQKIMGALALNPGQSAAEQLAHLAKVEKDYARLVSDLRKLKPSSEDMESIIPSPTEFPQVFQAAVDALQGLSGAQLSTAVELRNGAADDARGLPSLDRATRQDLAAYKVRERPWIAKRDTGMQNIETFMYKGEIESYAASAQKYLEACKTNLPAVQKNPTPQGMAYAYQCQTVAAKLPEYQNTLAELNQRQQTILGNLMGSTANTAGTNLGETRFISANGLTVSAFGTNGQRVNGLTAQGVSANGSQGYSALGFAPGATGMNTNVQSVYSPGALQTQFQQQGTNSGAVNFLNVGNGQRS